MPSLNASIDNHQQLYQFSCIPSAVEMILKLLGKVAPNYYNLQREWNNRNGGNFLDFHGRQLFGLSFTALHSPPGRGPNFPLGQLFNTIDDELRTGRYVVVSLEVENGNYHNYIVYTCEGDEYRAVTKGRQPEQTGDVKARIRLMGGGGTDILIYRPN